MLLAVDIGNTLTDWALFEKDELRYSFKTESNVKKSYDEYRALLLAFFKSQNLETAVVDGVIISSVVPTLGRIWVDLAKNLFHQEAVTVGPHLKTGLALKVDNPSEVGSDLVADAVGALALFQKPFFIADLGTANKFLFVDASGAFSGLAIAPGLSISMEALVDKTAALPEVSMVAPKKTMGKNTHDCMNSGITYGTAFQVEGFAQSFEKEAGYPLTKILTGGNALYVKDLLPGYRYEENLLLKGLNVIYARKKA
jgi:type III pantothenate kinase